MKVRVHIYRFRIVFARPHYTRIRIENALKPYILLYSPSILPPLLSSEHQGPESIF